MREHRLSIHAPVCLGAAAFVGVASAGRRMLEERMTRDLGSALKGRDTPAERRPRDVTAPDGHRSVLDRVPG